VVNPERPRAGNRAQYRDLAHWHQQQRPDLVWSAQQTASAIIKIAAELHRRL
jgi:hypothetical protein